MEKAVATSIIQINKTEFDNETSTVKCNDLASDKFLGVSYVEDSLDRITGDDGVRVVRIEEYKQAADALAEAFAEDDVAMYFIDTPDRQHWTKEQKWKLHVEILEYVTYAHILKGLVLTAGEDYGCVALWCVKPLLPLTYSSVNQIVALRAFVQSTKTGHSISR